MFCLQYQCKKPCARKNANCKEDHICSKQCYEECGDCRVLTEKKLPHCEHTGRMFCSVDPEIYVCKKKCSKILPCGHPCPNVCSDYCGNCQVQVSTRVFQSVTTIHLQAIIIVQNTHEERNINTHIGH
jgi:hypothetical protein